MLRFFSTHVLEVAEKLCDKVAIIKQGRLTSSPAYMLNCGLGILILPVMGIFLLIHDAVPSILDDVFSSSGIMNAGVVLICTLLCLVATMNDMADGGMCPYGWSISFYRI